MYKLHKTSALNPLAWKRLNLLCLSGCCVVFVGLFATGLNVPSSFLSPGESAELLSPVGAPATLQDDAARNGPSTQHQTHSIDTAEQTRNVLIQRGLSPVEADMIIEKIANSKDHMKKRKGLALGFDIKLDIDS